MQPGCWLRSRRKTVRTSKSASASTVTSRANTTFSMPCSAIAVSAPATASSHHARLCTARTE
jgi:hypothetical protein